MNHRSSGYRKRKAREGLESSFIRMDIETRNKKPKPKIIKGPRAEFLEKYKVEDYESAKKAINDKFGKDVFNDSVLKQWIEEDKENEK